tara:strand:+ start:625 stop:855 length:231 start_codon:yes stop_codon:yes gene_type:complete
MARRRSAPEVYAKRREFMNKYRFEVIGGALVYSITNKIIHGNVKILNGDAIAWQGLIAAVIIVIFISFIRGNITIK